MIIKVFGCPAVKKELYLLASLSRNDVEVEIVPPGLEREELQKKIDAARAEYILLAFGQCRLAGLCSRSVPLIAPRAHDCAHLLLGSAERYRGIFSENDDSPLWLNSSGCPRAGSQGSRCVVRGAIPGEPLAPLPEGVREYPADLSLLKSLVDLSFEPSQALIVPKNSRITADPVEIISCEPL